jgi:hypothetical protein
VGSLIYLEILGFKARRRNNECGEIYRAFEEHFTECANAGFKEFSSTVIA